MIETCFNSFSVLNRSFLCLLASCFQFQLEAFLYLFSVFIFSFYIFVHTDLSSSLLPWIMHVGSMSCSSISIIKYTRFIITSELISFRKCWGYGFGRKRTPLTHSYDHLSWTETINSVFSHCSISALIDCWKLNACQFEWALQSFKKCSVCKTGWLLMRIVHCHNRKITNIQLICLGLMI